MFVENPKPQSSVFNLERRLPLNRFDVSKRRTKRSLRYFNSKYSNLTMENIRKPQSLSDEHSDSFSKFFKLSVYLTRRMKFNASFISLASLLVLLFIPFPTVLAERQYVNKFAAQIVGGKEVADKIALQHGFVNLGQIGSLKDYFLFEHHGIEKRSLDYSHQHHIALKKETEVLWVEQQYEKKRVKRDISTNSRKTRSLSKFPDPLFSEQWYLHSGAFGNFDMNVVPVWEQGITGKGVVVTILDDGIQTNHPDLVQNYDPLASSDINGGDDDPMPQDNGDNKHGTRCAGEVAATAYNDFCGVGIAYNASIGGVRMLDGTVTDEVEARALSLNYGHIDIYSASWGPEDDGKTVDGPGRLAKSAFLEGITSGRRGKGSIFVWASGNGGRHQDNCNCDGYTNSIYTLSISSATQAGAKPWYLEECSSTLATTYSSGTPRQDENVVTVDMDMTYFRELQNQRVPNPASLCTKSHTGTSASAPIAAAIAALALEANPKLSWRDLQHLVVLSSRPEPLSREDGWVTNGVGRKVSHKFGYGLMDAAALVKLAQQWKNVPQQRVCHTPIDKQERQIPLEYGERLEVTMVTNGCQGAMDGVFYSEHVQVVITLQFQPRGNLHITLVSPSGTPSSVLLPRPFDSVENSFLKWPFLSVHFWGENPNGQWKLIVANEGRHRVSNPGLLKEWSLVFYGTEKNPVPSKRPTGRRRHSNLEVQNPCIPKYKKSEDSDVCVDFCPPGYFGDDQHICQLCNSECEECYGRGPRHCLKCPHYMYLSADDACVTECPDGFYEDPSTRDCLPCSSSCVTCDGAPDRCKFCKEGLFLYQDKCFVSCPMGTYLTENRCNACDPSCSACTGPRDDQCLYCNSNYYYLNGTCKDHCPEYYYEDFPVCSHCHRGCEACSNRESCNACFEGWILDNRGQCQVTNNCEHGYVSVDGRECVSCHSTCKECIGSNQFSCTECYDGSILYNGQCIQSCPSGYYKSLDNECVPCPLGCHRCTSFNSCDFCASGMVLQENKCLTSCGESWYPYNGKCLQCDVTCKSCQGPGMTNCTLCGLGAYLYNGACLNTCPDGFYKTNAIHNAQECLPCHHICSSCSGPGPTSCQTCPENSMLYNHTCYSCQRTEYYNREKRKCLACHSSCGNCTGQLETDCTACLSPLRLNSDSGTCLPCCDKNKSSSGGKCCSCSNDNSGLCGGLSDKTRSIISDLEPADETVNGEKRDLATSMRNIVPVIVGICSSAVLLFFLVFGVLQVASSGVFKKGFASSYKRVPFERYEGNSEKVALTREEDDDDEEEDLFEKT